MESAAGTSSAGLALALTLTGLAALAVLAVAMRRTLLRERARSSALRAALDARIWEDQVREVEQLEATVRELRQRGHDVNNALSTALLATQLFFETTSGEPLSDPARRELEAAADGMLEALQRLKALIETERRPETTAPPSSRAIQAVPLIDAVNACAARVRARYRRCGIAVSEGAPELRGLRVAVCGGELGLARLLDALLENACAGGGERESTRVEVHVGARLEVDVVALEIRDDGRGFSQTQLGRPIRPFETDRDGAVGLGLYTAERIARASGGSLRRANDDGGRGALVSLFLPIAPG